MRPSADLPGRAVALAPDVPAAFDGPLASHHRVIGRWVASHEEKSAVHLTRLEARQHIERSFNAAVLDILAPIEIANLRVVALQGNEHLQPAIAIICDDVGQLDLKWIEKSNVLSTTLFSNVAPLGWRAAAYKALVETLRAVLPVFAFDDLFDEVSAYYWDGETDDDAARQALMQWHGHSADGVDEMTLPSEMNGRRPDWMLPENAAPLKALPAGLADRLRALRKAHAAVKTLGEDGNAWRFDYHDASEYLPHLENCAHLPPLTLVPFDVFARELDDVCNVAMQEGFMDIAGHCPLSDAASIDVWFATLRTGVDMLAAAQAVIDFDPANPGAR